MGNPISKALCYFEYWTMEQFQKPSNPKCEMPSSEHFCLNSIDSN
jgi:hypothetical protein